MKLTNGKQTVTLTNDIQIRAYLSSGYTAVTEEKTEQVKKPTKRGAKHGDATD